jgi:hypothetical protein
MRISMFRSAAALLCCCLACGGMEAEGDAGDDLIESGTPHALGLGATATAGGKLHYYGGPILEHPKVVAVSWGAVDPQTAAHAGDFYSALLGSAAFSWLTEYDTKTQKIGSGSFAKAVRLTPSTRSKNLTDAQIEKELAAQIKKRALPAPDADTVYMIHFAPGIHIDLDGSGSCESGGFCGYHNAFKSAGKRIAYAVLPDMGTGSGCDLGCGSGTAFDRVTAVASHELTEATTDPEVGLATGLAAPLAWYDPNGGEIGDLCAGETGRVRGYLVQKEWSNSAKACILIAPGPEGHPTAERGQ